MTEATALIPVHQHAEPLRYAVASVLNQTLPDFELFLVGDGVTDAVRAVVEELLSADDRVRFFDFPKGPRKGEVHWHTALQEARGRFVAYLGSDDCWMSHHLEVMEGLLKDADFAHTLHVMIDKGQIVVRPADLQNLAFRERMLAERFNRVDFSFGGHTLEAYHRLPQGWDTIPPDFPLADLYLWRQFLAQPWCRVRSAWIPTGIHTATHLRPDLTDRERADDLAHWFGQIADPDFKEALWRRISETFGSQSVKFEFELRAMRSALRSENRDLSQENRALRKQNRHLGGEVERLGRESAARAVALSQMRNSTSWKMTSPLRRLRTLVRGL